MKNSADFSRLRYRYRRTSDQGVILITVLWILVILTALTIGLSHRIYFNTALVKNRHNQLKARMAVETGLFYFATVLKKDENLNYDSLSDVFINNEKEFKEHKISEGLAFSIQAIVYGAEPCNNKLNINHLNKAQLDRIYDNFKFDKDQMAALMDWIDNDDDPDNNGDGAEKDYYEDQEIPYSASNKLLTSWNQLYLVKDMNPEFAEYLKNNFTLYGDGKININFADKLTLQWTGLNEALIDKIHKFLEGDDGMPHTEDDNCFTKMDRIVSDLNDYSSLSQMETSELQNALSFMSVNSSFFMVSIKPVIQGQAYPYELKAIIQRDNRKINYLQVRQHYI